jgi:hypothetical protein
MPITIITHSKSSNGTNIILCERKTCDASNKEPHLSPQKGKRNSDVPKKQ